MVTADQEQVQISRHIYGHFTEHLGRCIYEGIWVGEDSPIPNVRGIRSDIVAALRHVHVPLLRWPGGCFADDYHWMDGIGPREQRPVRVNMWGNVLESNHFGTHEFMDLCEQVGCEPYISGNVGSGTPVELEQWVEYMTYPSGSAMSELRKRNGHPEPWRVKYWGIGNENWGCGGNMEHTTYAALYRQFQTFVRNYGDNEVYKIAGASGGAHLGGSGAEMLLSTLAPKRDGNFHTQAISLHYYAHVESNPAYSSTQFGEPEWFEVLRRALGADQAITNHRAVMDAHDPAGKLDLFLDEWGVWYAADPDRPAYELYQQNTLRDALYTALTLHIFHKHAERVKMANLAQVINVLQALILTDGKKMILTPTYRVMEMFKGHQDAMRLATHLECEPYTFDNASIPGISASASRGADGRILLTLCNVHVAKGVELTVEVDGASVISASGRILTSSGINAHNTFDAQETIQPQPYTTFKQDGNNLTLTVPAKSVIALTL